MKAILNSIWIVFRYQLPIHIIQVATSVLPDCTPAIVLRGKLVRPFIGQVGRNFRLGRDVTILNAFNLQVGDGVYLAKGVWINAFATLEIGDNCVLSPYVVISTLKHQADPDGNVASGESLAERTEIGMGSWLAAHSVVASGATFPEKSILGANSFYSGAMPEDSGVFIGGPARRVGDVKEPLPGYSSRADYLQSLEMAAHA